MRKTNEAVDIKATVPFLSPATIMIAVVIIFNIAIFDSVAASPFCKSDADEYAELIRLKPTVSPAKIAESYVLNFTTKGAGRESQAVWRRMSRSGESLEQAIEAHFNRYHADKSKVDRTALRRDVIATVGVIEKIRDLVALFEGYVIDADLVAYSWLKSGALNSGGSAQKADVYVDMIHRKTSEYIKHGMDPQQAAVRAGVVSRDARERDRGVSAHMIIEPGDPCFQGELLRYELWLRHQALIRDRPLSADDAGDLDFTGIGRQIDKVSPLSFYTHYTFGPRDYSFDRLEAIRLATESAAKK